MPRKKKKEPAPPLPPAIELIKDARQRKAAMVLAYAGYTKQGNRRNGAVAHAARQADVSRQTIYAWLEDEAFLEAINEVKTELITECFQGLRIAARKGSAQAIIELLAQLDPEFDRAWLRHKSDQAHEEKMLRLKIELAQLTPEDTFNLPDIVFRETAQGERIATPRDEELN
jgi:hypothetical protein